MHSAASGLCLCVYVARSAMGGGLGKQSMYIFICTVAVGQVQGSPLWLVLIRSLGPVERRQALVQQQQAAHALVVGKQLAVRGWGSRGAR